MSDSAPQLSASCATGPQERLRTLVEVFGQEWVNEFNDPVVFRSCCLSSRAATQFFNREFAEMSRMLFADTMFRRRQGFDQAVLDAFVAIATRKLADVQALINAECEQLGRLCEANGQQADAAYLRQQQMLVPIISPHAAAYLRCLVKLDELHRITGSAALNGVIDGEQRRVAEHHGHKAIRSLTGVLRNAYVSVRKESERVRGRADGMGQDPEPVNGGELQRPDAMGQGFQDQEKELQAPRLGTDPVVSALETTHVTPVRFRVSKAPELPASSEQASSQAATAISS